MELWKVILEHPNYEVSDQGNIRNRTTGHTLKHMFNADGYHRVDLNSKTVFVHRTVAKYFVHNPDNKPEVNHEFGDKNDNRACVLTWVTKGENQSHAYKIGLRCGKGTNNPASKLTADDVRAIRALSLRWCGLSASTLANKFSVHKSRIEKIRSRQNWSHV